MPQNLGWPRCDVVTVLSPCGAEARIPHFISSTVKAHRPLTQRVVNDKKSPLYCSVNGLEEVRVEVRKPLKQRLSWLGMGVLITAKAIP